MIKEVIILAGGLGTRLKETVPDLPKCMAPVAGKPFIQHVIDFLLTEKIEIFIFSLGFRSEVIQAYITTNLPGINAIFSVENEPLGTGGAIKKACSLATGKHVLITNGDTLFTIDVSKFSDFHLRCGAQCTLALKPMKDFSRYGSVELNHDYSLKEFREKQWLAEGLINGGFYALNKSDFLKEELPHKFSFEQEYLEKFYDRRRMFGVVENAYFIDIGIKEDYEKAQQELKP